MKREIQSYIYKDQFSKYKVDLLLKQKCMYISFSREYFNIGTSEYAVVSYDS